MEFILLVHACKNTLKKTLTFDPVMCVSLRRAEKTEVLSEDLLQVNMDFSLSSLVFAQTHTCIRFQWHYIHFPGGLNNVDETSNSLACLVFMGQHETANVSCHDFTYIIQTATIISILNTSLWCKCMCLVSCFVQRHSTEAVSLASGRKAVWFVRLTLFCLLPCKQKWSLFTCCHITQT